jgi:uncharacterized integral membrane protein
MEWTMTSSLPAAGEPDPVAALNEDQLAQVNPPAPTEQVSPVQHAPAAEAAAAPDASRAGQAAAAQHVVLRTRMGGIWIAAVSFAVVLLLLLIFILENGKKVDISYFGAHGHLPLGVALLLAAVLGVLLVVIPGTARIIQLRLVARRHRKRDGHLDSR